MNEYKTRLKASAKASMKIAITQFFFWLSGSQAEAQNKESLKRLYYICRLL